MKKVLIIYNSKTGNTKHLAKEIAKYYSENNISTECISIYDFAEVNIQQFDCVLLGCWTSGLFFFLQHPQKVWKEFAKKLPDLSEKKIALFTTYKIATGSMFANMKKFIKSNQKNKIICIKSRSGELNNSNIVDLITLIS